ncbi:acyltransferase domain-containing protein [Streptomyces sp. M19]
MVVSGPADDLAALLESCAAEDIWARRVNVDYASHSAQVDAVRDELAEALAPVARTADGCASTPPSPRGVGHLPAHRRLLVPQPA